MFKRAHKPLVLTLRGRLGPVDIHELSKHALGSRSRPLPVPNKLTGKPRPAQARPPPYLIKFFCRSTPE